MEGLIPGLPNEIAMECLIRLHFESFPNAIFVSKNWKREIESSEYLRKRIIGGHGQSIVVMRLAKLRPHLKNTSVTSSLTVFELKTRSWSVLPPIPGLSNSLPIFSQMVIMGTNLVVIVWCHLTSSPESTRVYIYNFLSNIWRRGADMPEGRPHFKCVSDSDRMVYVFGGYGPERLEMGPTFAYDLAKDEWAQLPPMELDHRLEAACLSGKLQVFGNYSLDARRELHFLDVVTQAFDPLTWKWSPASECSYSYDADFPNRFVARQNGKLYVLREGDVAVLENGECKKVADLPAGLGNMSELMMWKKHLALMEYEDSEWARMMDFFTNHIQKKNGTMFMLDLESGKWSNVRAPWDHSLSIKSSCYGEI